MSDNDDKNIWYWLTVSNPEFYFIGKLLGGDAERGADAAAEDLGPIFGVLIVLVVIGLIIFGIGRLFNIW